MTRLPPWVDIPRAAAPDHVPRTPFIDILDPKSFSALDLRSGSAAEIATLLDKYFGRSALVTLSAERDAREALRVLREEERPEIPRVWREMIDGPDPDLVALVVRRVRDHTGLRATPTDIAASLGMTKSDPMPQPISPRPPIGVKPPKGKRENSRPTAFRLWGHESPASSYAKVLVGVCAGIRRRHESDFIDRARSLWGSYRPWVSSDSTELIRPVALETSGLYAEVNLSAAAITDRCRRLLEAFGYSNTDLEIVFE